MWVRWCPGRIVLYDNTARVCLPCAPAPTAESNSRLSDARLRPS